MINTGVIVEDKYCCIRCLGRTLAEAKLTHILALAFELKKEVPPSCQKWFGKFPKNNPFPYINTSQKSKAKV